MISKIGFIGRSISFWLTQVILLSVILGYWEPEKLWYDYFAPFWFWFSVAFTLMAALNFVFNVAEPEAWEKRKI